MRVDTARTSELGWSVEPSTQTLRVGRTFTVRARAWSCGGREAVPIDVVWTVSDSTVLRVAQNGQVTGLRTGNAAVQGTDRSRYGVGPLEVPVTVQP